MCIQYMAENERRNGQILNRDLGQKRTSKWVKNEALHRKIVH